MSDVLRFGPAMISDRAALNDAPFEAYVLASDYDATIACLTERVRELEAALRGSIIALDDWLHDYAAEMCDAAKVAESRERIFEYGTIGYIATVQAANRTALAKREGG